MLKRCSKCHIEKPVEAFSKDRYKKDGLQTQCKDCVKEAVYSKPHRTLERKVCSGCHIEKSAHEFYTAGKAPTGLSNYCKSCVKERYEQNAEKERARVKAYYTSIQIEVPSEKVCRNCNRVLPANCFTRSKYTKTGLVSQCKECMKAKYGVKTTETRRKRRQQPGVNRDQKNRRKALRRNAPQVERISRRKVYERDEGKCYMCGKELSFDNFDLEHVIPLKRGGNHTYDNVKVACRPCNARKHTKLLDEL